MKPPPVLLFDLGGVLVDVAAFDALRLMVGEALDDDKLRDRWLRSPAVRSFELGRISPAAFATQFLDEWHVPLTPEAFLLDFGSWVRQPYPGAEELLARLRDRHHVGCLSNCNEVHWAKMAPLLGCFDSVFASHLLGKIKPDAGIFSAVMGELQVGPEEIRFFDDSRENVEAARRLGIPAFLVRGFDDLCRCLGNEGLL